MPYMNMYTYGQTKLKSASLGKILTELWVFVEFLPSQIRKNYDGCGGGRVGGLKVGLNQILLKEYQGFTIFCTQIFK